MYSFSVQNEYNEILELTHNSAYVVESIDGLFPPDGVINLSRNATEDGSVFNSAYIDNRQMIVTMAINQPVEENRQELYKFLKVKHKVRLFFSNENRDVYIDGYVQNMQIGFFDVKQVAQITVICPDPLFKSVDENMTPFSYVVDLFEFPFSIEIEDGVVQSIPFSEIRREATKSVINHGDFETGFQLEINTSGAVVDPIVSDSETLEYFGLVYSFQEGDLIRIDTRSGHKSVTLTRSGVTTSLIGYIKPGSTWMQLRPGDNVIRIDATSGEDYISAVFEVVDQFQGV
jgi:predicted phage tail component-like protein